MIKAEGESKMKEDSRREGFDFAGYYCRVLEMGVVKGMLVGCFCTFDSVSFYGVIKTDGGVNDECK